MLLNVSCYYDLLLEIWIKYATLNLFFIISITLLYVRIAKFILCTHIYFLLYLFLENFCNICYIYILNIIRKE